MTPRSVVSAWKRNCPPDMLVGTWGKKPVVIITTKDSPDVRGKVRWSWHDNCYVFSLEGVILNGLTKPVDEAFFSPEVIGIVCNCLTTQLGVYAMKGLYPPGTEATGKVTMLKDWSPV